VEACAKKPHVVGPGGFIVAPFALKRASDRGEGGPFNPWPGNGGHFGTLAWPKVGFAFMGGF